jgi:outer membrane protein assembly factor BamD (BamD/ComL family)
MLTIGALREDEGKYEQAVQVYENLRNLYPQSKEAAVAVRREADSRMTVLREREYNRSRCKDTAGFLASALTMCGGDDVQHIRALHEEVLSMLEDDAFRSAKFYDSRVRTPRSAVNAYERYLADYPQGKHVDEVRRRLEELKGAHQK